MRRLRRIQGGENFFAPVVEPIGSADQINVSEAGITKVMLKTKNKTKKHHDSKLMIVSTL
jgi:hypothetical protein